MKIKIAVLFVCLCAIYSCSDDTPRAAAISGPDSYRFYYMDYPSASSGGEDSDKNVDVIYDSSGNVIKLTGDVSAMDSGSGYSWFFRKDIFKEITYSGNTATMVSKLDSEIFTVLENRQIVEFSSDGKLISKILVNNYDPNYRDTIRYTYEGNLLKHYELRHNHALSKSEIYYNAQQNIDSIVTRLPDFSGYFDPQSKKRTVVKFKNYDTTPSPFKRLIMFDETFNRALSANNYAKWSSVTFDVYGEITASASSEWTFTYQNGLINFSL